MIGWAESPFPACTSLYFTCRPSRLPSPLSRSNYVHSHCISSCWRRGHAVYSNKQNLHQSRVKVKSRRNQRPTLQLSPLLQAYYRQVCTNYQSHQVGAKAKRVLQKYRTRDSVASRRVPATQLSFSQLDTMRQCSSTTSPYISDVG
jgi:hypothetical protein